MMNKFQILDRSVGLGQPPYFIAQLAPEELRTGDRAETAVEAAAHAGAEAIDLHAPSMVAEDIASRIRKSADRLGIAVIATHYSEADLRAPLAPDAAVQGLAYPLLVHQGLVAQAAALGRPLFIATEACELAEIEAAYQAARAAGGEHMAILHHVGDETDAPANLHTLLDMSFRFNTVIGLADRSPGATVATAAVALGASLVLKPFTADESAAGSVPTPAAFAHMAQAGRAAWTALGLISYGLSDTEKATRAQRTGNGNLLAG